MLGIRIKCKEVSISFKTTNIAPFCDRAKKDTISISVKKNNVTKCRPHLLELRTSCTVRRKANEIRSFFSGSVG